MSKNYPGTPLPSEKYEVLIYRRKHVVSGDERIYQADITLPDLSHHHSVAATPQDALLGAVTHWTKSLKRKRVKT